MATLYTTKSGLLFHAGQIALIMVGLPARGKTFISQKLGRYLQWIGVRTRTFDVGKYRRDKYGAKMPHEFFDPDNKEGYEIRRQVALAALQEMLAFFSSGGQVGIYDATNSTQAMRSLIQEHLDNAGVKVIFLECICTDPSVVTKLIQEEMATSPDYQGLDPAAAAQDFIQRIQHYERRYETIADPAVSYVKLINACQSLVVNKVQGYLQSRIIHYLMNMHTMRRSIYLCPEAQASTDGVDCEKPFVAEGLSHLSPRGFAFSVELHDYLTRLRAKRAEESGAAAGHLTTLAVWTSPSERSKETAQHFAGHIEWMGLAGMNRGVAAGLTEPQIAEKLPSEYELYRKDPFNHRYRRGESYRDVAVRLEPILIELERCSDDVLIVAPELVLRFVWAYYTGVAPEDVISQHLAEGCVVELCPRPYRCVQENHAISSVPWQ